MQRPTRLKVIDVNPHLSCILCGGYFIDATTITECLHSFCRACIVRYLETSKYCPVCEVQVHKTRPLQSIRPDKTLQDIVYKLIPGLYQNEMKRRRELYSSQPPEAVKLSHDAEDRGECLDERFIYTPDEIFSFSIEYDFGENGPPDKLLKHEENLEKEEEEEEDEEDNSDPRRRFLRCPAAVRVTHLKKFIRMKYGIPTTYEVDLRYQDESLQDDYTLIDVAYIYSWKRGAPMRFFYRINERPAKKMKTYHEYVSTDVVPDEEEEKQVEEHKTEAKEEETVEKEVEEETECPSESPSSIPNAPSESEKVEEEAKSPPVPSENEDKNIIPVCENTMPSENPSVPEPPVIVEECPMEVVIQNEPVSESETPEKKLSESKDVIASIAPVTPVQNSLSPIRIKTCTTPNGTISTTVLPADPTSFPVCEPVKSKKSKKSRSHSSRTENSLTLKITRDLKRVTVAPVEEEKMDLDREFDMGPLVIAEPETVTNEEEEAPAITAAPKTPPSPIVDITDKTEHKKSNKDDDDDCEVDSGRGSDSSSRAEVRSMCGDEDIASPASSVRTPELEKASSLSVASPSSSSLPSPLTATQDSSGCGSNSSNSADTSSTNVNGNAATPSEPATNDIGALDLSTSRRICGVVPSRPTYVPNPPVLDKHRQTNPCLPLPKHPSFKLLPMVLPHAATLYKKPPDVSGSRNNFRCRGSTLTVINPDPNSTHPKLVIKNLDPRPDHTHSSRHHHYHHHHNHHQRM